MSRHKSKSPEKFGSYPRANSRKPKEIILIVCEGKETEPNYFGALCKHLKLKPLEVVVVGQGGAAITVVEKALELQTKRDKEAKDSLNIAAFDEVWCVFDVENLSQNPSYHSAVNKAQDNKLELALCNPCIEFWFLLHFGYNTQPFGNCKEAKVKMKTCISGYQESMPVFEKIRDKTNDAIENAERMLEKHPNLTEEIALEEFPHNRVKKLNPSTTVHLLVKKLMSMSSNPL